MPKHIAFGMAVRHLSGSAQLVGLLNGFGYSVSHSFILEHDTALAQQEFERGSIALPYRLAYIRPLCGTTTILERRRFQEKGQTHNTSTHNVSYL